MNRVQRYRAEKARGKASVIARLAVFGIGKLIALMLGLSVAIGLGSVHLIPLAVKAGLAPPVADKLPYAGFVAGALIGLAAAISRAVMDALQIGLAVPLALVAVAGSLLAVISSALWTIAYIDAFLVAAALLAVFALVAFVLDKLLGTPRHDA
jgi:hypothetical protein